jgi:hypothetical protein
LGTSLGRAWEWNHNPDTTKFTVNNRTVPGGQHAGTRHRIQGPNGVGTAVIDIGNMAGCDRAGLALFATSQGGWA